MAVRRPIRPALAAVLSVPMAVSGCGLGGSEAGGSPEDWKPIAASPLSARSGAAAVWTGDEMILVGGSTQAPCPAGADCIGPTLAQLSRDGAAYDPAADTWRPVADAPEPIAGATPTWTGSTLVLLVPPLSVHSDGAALRYDPGADRWRRLDDPPDPYLRGGEWTGDQVVYWQSEETPHRADWSLDPDSGSWTRIPEDPFPSTFDRSYTWTGDRFVFIGLLTSIIDDDGPAADVYQVADYLPDTGTGSSMWRELPPSEVGFWSPTWFFHDGVLVNPAQDAAAIVPADQPPVGGQFNPGTGAWSPVPQTGDSADERQAGCQLPAIGSAGDWVIGGGPVLVSLSPPDTQLAPACGELAEPDVATWTGSEVIVWGGPDADYRENLDVGYAWEPPPAG